MHIHDNKADRAVWSLAALPEFHILLSQIWNITKQHSCCSLDQTELTSMCKFVWAIYHELLNQKTKDSFFLSFRFHRTWVGVTRKMICTDWPTVYTLYIGTFYRYRHLNYTQMCTTVSICKYYSGLEIVNFKIHTWEIPLKSWKHFFQKSWVWQVTMRYSI